MSSPDPPSSPVLAEDPSRCSLLGPVGLLVQALSKLSGPRFRSSPLLIRIHSGRVRTVLVGGQKTVGEEETAMADMALGCGQTAGGTSGDTWSEHISEAQRLP